MTLDTTTWRTHPHKQRMYLYVDVPEVIFSCSVNMSAFTYPLAQLTYDTVTVGAYTDIIVDQLVRVKSSGGVFKGWGRIRLTPTSSILYIGHVSNGEINFADNDIVEVLDQYRVQARVPRDLANGTMYKDYDLVYSDQGSKINPKCNAGGPVIGFIDPADSLLHVSFSLTNSIPVASGATLSSYGGSVVDGTVTSGSIASGTFTATFPAGKRTCLFTTTDSNGKVGTVHVPVIALTGVDDSMLLPCSISRHEIDIQSGATLEFIVNKADVSKIVVVPGTLVILFTDEEYGTTKGSLAGVSGRENVCFVGWLTENQNSVEPTLSDVTFTAVDIIGRLSELPAFPQTLFHKTSPNDWTKIKNLSLFRFIYYLLLWHSTATSVTDLLLPDWNATYTQTPARLDADAGTLLSQMQTTMSYLDGIFLADKSGLLKIPRNPQFMSDADRGDVVTTVTLRTSDYKTAEWTERHNQFIYWLRGSGVVADNTSITAKLAISPGTSPSQGSSESTLDRQLIIDQTDLNIRTGRKYALENNEIPDLSVELSLAGRVIELANAEFIQFNLPVTLNRRQTAFSNSLFIPKSVSIEYDDSGLSTEKITLEPIIYGVAATTQAVPKDKSKDSTYTVPNIDTYDYIPPSDTILVSPIQAGIAFTDSPALYVWNPDGIARLRKGSSTWELVSSASDIASDLTATIWDLRLDPWNPKNCLYLAMHGTAKSGLYAGSPTAYAYRIDNLDTVINPVMLLDATGREVEPSTHWRKATSLWPSINVKGLLLAALYDYTAWFFRILRIPTLNGTWQTVNADAPNGGNSSFIIGYHFPNGTVGKIYMAYIPAFGTPIRIQKSTDMGVTWTTDYNFTGDVTSGETGIMTMCYANSNDERIYATNVFFNQTNSIVRRNLNGTYTDIAPLVGGIYASARILDVYTNDSDILTIYADNGVTTQLMLTQDGGDTWEVRNAPSGTFLFIGGWPYDPEIKFAVTSNGVFTTNNFISGGISGVTWTDITYNLGSLLTLSALMGAVPVWVS